MPQTCWPLPTATSGRAETLSHQRMPLSQVMRSGAAFGRGSDTSSASQRVIFGTIT